MMICFKPWVEAWEIRIAHVYFDDNPNKGMVHPVLTIDEDYDHLPSLLITTQKDDSKFPKVFINDWMSLGLKRESWLKLSPVYRIKIDNFSPNLVGLPDQWLVDYVKNWMLQNPND